MRAARAAYPAYLQRVEEHSGMRVELAFPGTLIPNLEDGRQVELEVLTAKFIDLGARAQ